jgi:hypothetical protein
MEEVEDVEDEVAEGGVVEEAVNEEAEVVEVGIEGAELGRGIHPRIT